MGYNRELEERLATEQLSLGEYKILKIICIKDYSSGDGTKIWLKSGDYYHYSKAGILGPCHFYDLQFKFLFAFGVDFFIKHFHTIAEHREYRINKILE